MSLSDTISDYRWRFNEYASNVIEERQQQLKRGAGACAVLLLLGGGVYWWTSVRFHQPPSIFDAPVDDVFGYLSMADFSKLPLEERLAFLLSLADRFRNFSQGDSAAAAAFLAGLAGPAREQATQNVRLLAKDILAQGAAGYFDVPESERGNYIDSWLLRWMKTGERAAKGEEGAKNEETDEERLKDLKENAKRGEQRRGERGAGAGGGGESGATNPLPTLTTDGATRFLDFWGSDVESASTPREQGQIVRFLGDVRKRMLQ